MHPIDHGGNCSTSTKGDAGSNNENVPLNEDTVVGIEEETASSGVTEEQVVRHYYHKYKKYSHIYSGLQFGCHLVLYTKHPDLVHSDYAIYILPSNGIPWYTIQTLVRMMADLHKTLILVHVSDVNADATYGNSVRVFYQGKEYWLDEFAITTEHAPFRHTIQKQRFQQLSSSRKLVSTEIVGTQLKKKAKTAQKYDCDAKDSNT